MTVPLLVVGDDFTPAAMLADAIADHERIDSGDLDLRLHDLVGGYTQGPDGDLAEFVGSPAELHPLVGDVRVIVTTFAPVDASVLAAAPHLELVLCGRGGPVNIDVRAAEERGVVVRNCPGRNADAVAEYVVGLMVSLTRRVPQAAAWVRAGSWIDPQEDSLRKPTGPQLGGRTLGIVGFGAVGRRVAALMAPWDMRVLAADPFVDDPVVRESGAEPVGLATLLADADIVTIHSRPTDGRPVLGTDEVAAMKRGAYLINTSRGVNLDEDAVLAALDDGRLAGAALDVMASEPPAAGHRLVSHPDVIVTPHAAGVSTDVPRHTARLLAGTLADWLADG